MCETYPSLLYFRDLVDFVIWIIINIYILLVYFDGGIYEYLINHRFRGKNWRVPSISTSYSIKVNIEYDDVNEFRFMLIDID